MEQMLRVGVITSTHGVRGEVKGTSITAWVISNEYLTEPEILNNAVMMYRYLSSGGGGGGTFGRENSLPVYMMILRHPYLF